MESHQKLETFDEQEPDVEEDNAGSWQDRFMNKLSSKADKAHFVTNIIGEKNSELFKTPHLRKMYSESFYLTSHESKTFCADLFMLLWKQQTEQAKDKPGHSGMNEFQRLADTQSQAQSCVAEQMNLFLDSVTHLSDLYGDCKSECLEGNPTLAKEIKDSEAKDSMKSKYYDPMTADPCLQTCRTQFYYLFKSVNKYLQNDKGFYTESVHKYS